MQAAWILAVIGLMLPVVGATPTVFDGQGHAVLLVRTAPGNPVVFGIDATGTIHSGLSDIDSTWSCGGFAPLVTECVNENICTTCSFNQFAGFFFPPCGESLLPLGATSPVRTCFAGTLIHRFPNYFSLRCDIVLLSNQLLYLDCASVGSFPQGIGLVQECLSSATMSPERIPGGLGEWRCYYANAPPPIYHIP